VRRDRTARGLLELRPGRTVSATLSADRSIESLNYRLQSEGTLDQAKKYGVVDVDASGKVRSFVEKPANPASTQIGIALYYYPKKTLPLIRQYIAEGNNPDQPGRLIQWLYPKQPVYTWSVPGIWYDIGSKETLEEANRIFARK
jgi:glucose-1-phosphate thymidylyltransferase